MSFVWATKCWQTLHRLVFVRKKKVCFVTFAVMLAGFIRSCIMVSNGFGTKCRCVCRGGGDDPLRAREKVPSARRRLHARFTDDFTFLTSLRRSRAHAQGSNAHKLHIVMMLEKARGLHLEKRNSNETNVSTTHVNYRKLVDAHSV